MNGPITTHDFKQRVLDQCESNPVRTDFFKGHTDWVSRMLTTLHRNFGLRAAQRMMPCALEIVHKFEQSGRTDADAKHHLNFLHEKMTQIHKAIQEESNEGQNDTLRSPDSTPVPTPQPNTTIDDNIEPEQDTDHWRDSRQKLKTLAENTVSADNFVQMLVEASESYGNRSSTPVDETDPWDTRMQKALAVDDFAKCDKSREAATDIVQSFKQRIGDMIRD